MAVNGLGAEDLPANSSRHVDEQGLDIHAAGGRLIGFYCPSCGYAPRADGADRVSRRCVPAPRPEPASSMSPPEGRS
jgi:hypothetical protein